MGNIQRMPTFTLRENFPLIIKGIVYKSCVRSAMHYGSVIWYLGHNDIGVLQRTERAMVRSIREVKLVDKNLTKDQMRMLDGSETVDQLAKTNSVRWNRLVL